MQLESWKSFFSNLLLIAAFYSLAGLLFILFETLNSNSAIFSLQNFLNWDALHYDTIRRNGYHTGMVAFFPLFPFTWGILGFSAAGMALLNGSIYVTAFAWLASEFKIPKRNLVLLCSIPSLLFMFLPYSESFFFTASCLLLVGLQKKNTGLALAGILLAGLSRPVATIFIPAILVMDRYYQREQESSRKTFSLVAAAVGGFLLVMAVQWFQTGTWFTFFQVQKDWNNYLRIPVLPFNSWAGGLIVRLDAMALFFCMLSTAILIFWFAKKQQGKTEPAVVFSVAYLAILGLVMLATRGGIFNSLNRYTFATPFFIIAFNSLLNYKLWSPKNLLWLFLISSSFWLLFASYVHIQTLLKFELLTIFLCLAACLQSNIKWLQNISFWIILIVNIFFMEYFFHRFLSGNWVG